MESKISEGKKEVFTDLKKEIELKHEAQTKERDESIGELKTSIEKKLRGLAKKLRGELETADNCVKDELDVHINKNKQEINLIQTQVKVVDEKILLIEDLNRRIKKFEEGDNETFMKQFFEENFSKSEFLTYFDRKFGAIV